MLFDYRSHPDVPDDWRIEPIERLIVDIGDGGTPPRSDPSNFGGGIAWAVIEDINKHITSTKETLSSRGIANSNAKVWPPRSVVVSTGATIGRVGVACVPLATKQGITGIIPNDALINSEYFATVLRTGAGTLERFSQGSTFREIRPPTLIKLRMRVPPLVEQTRIAAVLDTVDEAIVLTEAVIAKLKQMRVGLLHDLLVCGLDEHKKLRDPVIHPEQFRDSNFGQIPMEWEVLTLEQLTDPQAPICYGIVQVHEYVADGVFVLAIRDILGDYVTGLHKTAPSIDASYARSRVRPGDVLISIKGTIGRIGLVPSHYNGNISRDLARIRPSERVVPEFLIHLLRSPIGQKTLELAQVGTTRAELSIAPLKQLKFPLPPVSEQQLIAEILNGQDDLIAKHEREREKLCQIKSGLMSDLLTGRVHVPEALDLMARSNT